MRCSGGEAGVSSRLADPAKKNFSDYMPKI